MENYKLFDAEMKFMNIVWSQEPLTTRQLTEACQVSLGWKRTTTYTVLKKLSERGIVQNVDSTVTALVKREQVQQYESEAVVDRTFGGSLPSFIAAFVSGRSLSEEDAQEILDLIDQCRGKES
mgnify:FL=1